MNGIRQMELGCMAVESGDRPKMEINVEQRNLIRRLLDRRFSLDELKSLSFDIGLDYESIPHSTKGEFMREIILLCARKGMIYELLKALPIEYLDESFLHLIRDFSPAKKRSKKKNTPVTILLADPHPIVRQGLRMFLGLDTALQIVGEAISTADCIGLLSALKPDVLLIEFGMKPYDKNIRLVLSRINLASPNTRILILTSIIGVEEISSVLQFGVSGYLTKDTDAHALANAIHLAHKGMFLLSPLVAARVSEFVELPSPKSLNLPPPR